MNAAVPSAACLMKLRLVFSTSNVLHFEIVGGLTTRVYWSFPLQRSRLLQCIFHSGPALYGRTFWCARSAPVRFETHDMMIAVALQSLVLTHPVDRALAHRGPFNALGCLGCVFAVAMTDSGLRQEIIPVGIRYFAEHGCVARVPIEHESRRGYAVENLGGFCPSCGIAGKFILQNKDQTNLA